VSDQPTVGIDFVSTNVKSGDVTIRLQIWDTAGQEQFRSLIPAYLRGSTIAILVYSVDSRESFDDLGGWIHFLQNTANPRMIVAGNKTDLSARAVPEQDGAKFAASAGAHFVETSAREGRGIDELLAAIVATPIQEAAPVAVPALAPPADAGGMCDC
jgi:Ras-related protein Rab-6A